jgi:hypothetical protein
MSTTENEKMIMAKSLNWDYAVSDEDIISIIEERNSEVKALNREKLFLRSLERLSWQSIVTLWGIDAIKKMYTPDLSLKLFPKSLKQKYDIILSILQGHSLSDAGWSSERAKKMQHTFLSNRWNRIK